MSRAERTFQRMPLELRKVEQARILVLAPHMDDEVIAPGGTLALHRQVGSRTGVVFATDSSAGMPERQGLQLSRLRTDEAGAAAESLGYEILQFMNFPDGQLAKHERAMGSQLAEIIREFQPDQIFSPFPTDHHRDHQATAVALTHAIRETRWEGEVWNYEVWSPLWPNVLIDITSVIEEKTQAIRCHESQVAYRPYVEATLGLNRYRGLKAKVDYAEAYFVCDARDFLYFADELLGHI